MYEMGESSPGSRLAMSRVAGTAFGLSLRRTFFLPLLMVKDFNETVTKISTKFPMKAVARDAMRRAETHNGFGP